MNQPSLTIPSRTNPRSMGLKLMIICGLAVLMTIPSFFVNELVSDRTRRASDVIHEISSHVGGPQTFLGPTLAVPYTIPAPSAALYAQSGVYLVFPAQATADIQTSTTERHRSLFRVPVFEANLKFEATFDLEGIPAAAPPGAELDWNRAEIVVGVTGARGALADANLTMEAKTAMLAPSAVADILSFGANENSQSKMSLLGTKIMESGKPPSPFHVASTLRFSGGERIAVLAYGKTTRVKARGDWRNPGFDGGFLPITRTVSDQGFHAEWSVPFIARGVHAEGPIESMTGLNATALGVSFIEVADAYQSVDRSLKYVLLVLGLVFLSYFVFEVTTGKPIHPAQYVLVGIAQIIFYLLLLSIAERMGFDLGFMLAAIATITLLAANVGWIFSGWLHAVRAFFFFAFLYLWIYLLLRLEDNALLVGAISSFLAVTAVMYFTRGMNWYGSLLPSSVAEHESISELPKNAI